LQKPGLEPGFSPVPIVVSALFMVCGIAAQSISRYNEQPSKVLRRICFAESAFIWLVVQEDGQLPIFFWLNRFEDLEISFATA
jgi:hypothetical protein